MALSAAKKAEKAKRLQSDIEAAKELYEQLKPGHPLKTAQGIAVVKEKFLSSGELPHAWTQTPGKETPISTCLTTVEEIKTPTAVVFCAGGGGVECAFKELNVTVVASVEMNPEKPELSNAIADVHEHNFPEIPLIRKPVQVCAEEGFPGFPTDIDFLWASPMCANFSNANQQRLEEERDVAVAYAIAKGIQAMNPKHFLLENVREYQKSESWGIIKNWLENNGYYVAENIVDLSEYGIPQTRSRLIVWACRKDVKNYSTNIALKPSLMTWDEAIGDLLPNLKLSKLTKGQMKRVEAYRQETGDEKSMLIVNRSGGYSGGKAVPEGKPGFTIMAESLFSDGKGGRRRQFIDVLMPDGSAKTLDLECIKRLQTFPDWYELPDDPLVAGTLLGYAVPPKFGRKLIEVLLEKLEVRDSLCEQVEDILNNVEPEFPGEPAAQPAEENDMERVAIHPIGHAIAIAVMGGIDFKPHEAEDGEYTSWAIEEGRIYVEVTENVGCWLDKTDDEFLMRAISQCLMVAPGNTKVTRQEVSADAVLPDGKKVLYWGDNVDEFTSQIAIYLNGLNQDEESQDEESQDEKQEDIEPSHVGLRLNEVRRDGGTQAREKIDIKHVKSLVELLNDGVELDPITVFYDGENYWLADGFHRCKANRDVGNEDIQAIVHQGTRRDAILYSCGANADHKVVKPRRNADKRRAVVTLLKDPEWGKWNSSEIARIAKVSHAFVINVRKQLIELGEIGETPLVFSRQGTEYERKQENIPKSSADFLMKISRPALRYFGGKWRVAQKIASQFKHHQVYCEPFGGAFSVGLRKISPPGCKDVYNDTEGGIVNFWYQLRDNGEELIVKLTELTFDMDTIEWAKTETEDPLEAAIKYYVHAQVGYCGGGIVPWSAGFSHNSVGKKNDCSHLKAIAKHIQDLEICQKDAFDIIREFDSPETLFYVDPPYQEINSKKGYLEQFTVSDHERLVRVLKGVQGQVVLSGYDNDLYDQALDGWTKVEFPGFSTGTSQKQECLWIKPIAQPSAGGVAAPAENVAIPPMNGVAAPAVDSKTKKCLTKEYLIGFTSNLPYMSVEQLRLAKQEIEKELASRMD